MTRNASACALLLVLPMASFAGDFERGKEALGKKDYDLAIACFDAHIREKPKDVAAYERRGTAYLNKKEYDKAIKDYTEAIRLDPKYADAYDSLAWALATCPRDAVRKGGKVVEYATKACELSGWKDAGHLSTLAAAKAEAGKFGEAVQWQKESMEVGKYTGEEGEKAHRRLKLYEANKPYRADGGR